MTTLVVLVSIYCDQYRTVLLKQHFFSIYSQLWPLTIGRKPSTFSQNKGSRHCSKRKKNHKFLWLLKWAGYNSCMWFPGSGSQILPEFESVDLNEIPEASSQTSEALSEQLKVWTWNTVNTCTANEGPVRILYKCLVPIYVFPEMKLLFPKRNYNVLSPSSFTHISVRNLYISRIGLPILLQGNMWTNPGNI